MKYSVLQIMAAGVALACAAGCGSEPGGGGSQNNDGGAGGSGAGNGTNSGAGNQTGGSAADGAGPGSMQFNTGTEVDSYLDGKLLVMEGNNIPSHPNGIDRNVNAGQATQCLHKTEMRALGGIFNVTTWLGTLNGAPNEGDVGSCDTGTPFGDPLAFDSTTHIIENVTGGGSCFDFNIDYGAFGQQGRGSITESTLKLELFFSDAAEGHRCADGVLGGQTVKMNGNDFTGDAVTTYVISEGG